MIYSFSFNEILANDIDDNKINCNVHNIKLKIIEQATEFEKLLEKKNRLEAEKQF